MTPSRFHQIRHEEKLELGAGDKVPLEVLRGLPLAEKRLMWCQDTVDATDAPAIVTDCTGTVLALNAAAARLLYRSSSDVLGRPIEEVGVRALGTEQAIVTRAQWDAGVRHIVLLRAKRSDDEVQTPIGLTDERRRVVEAARAAVERDRGGSWVVETFPASFPVLGGGERRLRARTIQIGEGPPSVVLRYFVVPTLTSTISEDTAALVVADDAPGQVADQEPGAGASPPSRFERLERDQARFLELMTRYAKTMATDFLAESATIFTFRGPFCPAPRDPDIPGATKARALLPIGRFGQPEALSSREIFYGRGADRGLVLNIMDGGRSRVIDFSDPRQYEGIRLPNFYNASWNARLGKLYNGVIVPIVLEDTRDEGGGRRQAVGAIRLLNCFRPTSGERFEAQDPSWAVETLERVARRIGLLHRHVWRRAQWTLLNETIANVDAIADLEEFLERLSKDALHLLSFEHIAVWRPRSRAPGLALDHYAGNAPSVPKAVALDGDPPGEALRLRQPVHVTPARVRRCTAESNAFFARVQNGFEVPIIVPGAKPHGTIGFYDTWVADEDGPYTREMARLCGQLGRLVGIKVALAGKASR